MYLAHVSSSSKNNWGLNSIDSIIFAAILVEPEAELVLKDLGLIFATAGRLLIKGDTSTPVT